MKNRVLIGLAAAGIIGGATYGFAATLDVNPNSLAAGSELVASCDTDGVTTSYATGWDATDERYEVTSVTVSGIAAACEDDADIKVELVKSDGTSVGNGEGVVGTGTSVTLAISETTAAASDVGGVHVVIDG